MEEISKEKTEQIKDTIMELITAAQAALSEHGGISPILFCFSKSNDKKASMAPMDLLPKRYWPDLIRTLIALPDTDFALLLCESWIYSADTVGKLMPSEDPNHRDAIMISAYWQENMVGTAIQEFSRSGKVFGFQPAILDFGAKDYQGFLSLTPDKPNQEKTDDQD